MQAESKLSRLIVNALNARGHFVWKNHGSAFTLKGLADISGATVRGISISLEVKLPGKEREGLAKHQFDFLSRMAKRCPNAIVSVVSSVKGAIEAVEGSGRATVAEGMVLMLPGEIAESLIDLQE